jgi:hypothetical protein
MLHGGYSQQTFSKFYNGMTELSFYKIHHFCLDASTPNSEGHEQPEDGN